jgi:hypothetical protein
MPQIESVEPFAVSRAAEAPTAPISWARACSAGVLAGEVAGITMALAMIGIFHFALDRSPFMPFQVIGATVIGASRATNAAPVVSVLGLFVHQLVPSVVWGLAYGVAVVYARPKRARTLLFLGLAVGAVAQIVDVYMFLPWAEDLGLFVDHYARYVHPVWSWLYHFAFGVGLSFYPWKYDPTVARFV